MSHCDRVVVLSLLVCALLFGGLLAVVSPPAPASPIQSLANTQVEQKEAPAAGHAQQHEITGELDIATRGRLQWRSAMLIQIWTILQSISTVGVLVALAVLPFCRDLLAKYLASAVDHRLEQDRARLKSDLARAEEQFKAQLNAQERRVKDAASVALAGLAGRNSALDSRRLKAVENLWAAKAELDRAKFLSETMGHLRLDVVSSRIEHEPNLQQLFKMYADMLPLETWKGASPVGELTKDKPFLSARVWMIYAAYQRILGLSIAQVQLLANGMRIDALIDETRLREFLKGVLPEYSDYIEKYGVAGFHRLVDVLDQKLLEATQEMLSGKAWDEASLKQATALGILADALAASPSTAESMQDSPIPSELKSDTPPPSENRRG
jgi:hypothetical protein